MFTVSILNNTNNVLCSSQDNLSYIREGSFIKIGNDEILYNIIKTNKIFYIKDFEYQSNKILLINDNIGINLQINDIIKISYKEYELQDILEIKNNGKLYTVGEILTIIGGDSVIDLNSGLSNPTQLIVEEIDEKGGIKRLGLKNVGKYIIPPTNNVIVNSKNGQDLILVLKYETSDNRQIIERTIENIEYLDNKTLLFLNYSLPNGIKNGKLSLQKYEIILSSNYLGENKIGVPYQIFKDFTPHLGLCLMTKNSLSSESIFNKNMYKIEQEIKKLQDLLKKN